MRMRHFAAWLLSLVLAALCCTPAWAAESEPAYVRTVFNKTNGLSTDEANAVLQTKDGYLWVGSFGGLLRYDGTSFRDFSAEGAITTQSIRTLYEDSTGRLWIGSGDAGVFVYENGAFTQVPCTEKYGFLNIRDFAEGSDGTIYVASSSGVCRIHDGCMVPYRDELVNGETIFSLGVDSHERLWCVMNAGRCAVMQDGHVLSLLEPELFFPGNEEITCLATDSDRNIYLGTKGTSVAKATCTGSGLDASDFSVRMYNVPDAAIHNRIHITASGDILVSGQKGFAWLTSDGQLRDSHSGVATEAVNCAALDYEGNVWLASSNEGLVRYNPGCCTSPNLTAGLTGRDLNAVTAAGGLYYTATDQGLLAFDSDWHPLDTALTQRLTGVHVQNLMVDSLGRLWCGTYSGLGLVRYDPASGDITLFNSSNGLYSASICVSYEMADGTVAVGTQDGLALIRDDEVAAFYNKGSGMETQSILCLTQAPNGTLLAGSAGSGIYALSADGSLKKYSYDQGLADGVVLRILPEEGGKSAFVSAGSHLYHWKDGSFTRLDNLRVGPGFIFDMYERDGRLWLLQDGGIYAVDKAPLLAGKEAHVTKYGTAQGITGSLKVNTWHYLAPDGSLYLATRNGVSVFGFQGVSTPLPQLAINSVRVDGKTYENLTRITLSSSAQRMTIDFSALTFSGAADLCIGYQLVGFAKNETVLEHVAGGTVSYTNLAGGDYIFRLRVFDPNNPDSVRSIQLSVTKDKALSEQPLFWIGCLLLLIVAIMGAVHVLIRARMERMRQQQQAYRSILEQSLRTFANAIDAKDPYTNGHSVRVAQYAREITRRLGYSPRDQETVYYVALLHDIGKIGIPDSILNKTGALTPEEQAIIRTHPVKGGEILRDFTALKGIADGARYHHERYDGKGYCAGLAGEEIPLMARIICVADSYDAMSSDRCYRKALPTEKIVEELRKGSGTQFDPHIASVMEDMIREGAVPIPPSQEEKPDSQK